MTAKFWTFSAMAWSVSSIIMHWGSQSWPKRMTTTRSSSDLMASSTCQPDGRWGRKYDMLWLVWCAISHTCSLRRWQYPLHSWPQRQCRIWLVALDDSISWCCPHLWPFTHWYIEILVLARFNPVRCPSYWDMSRPKVNPLKVKITKRSYPHIRMLSHQRRISTLRS